MVDANVKNHSVKQITFTCDPRRPRVELPAVGDRVRWEFMQLPGESEETLKRDETASPRSRRSRFARPFLTMPRTTRFASTIRSVRRWPRRR